MKKIILSAVIISIISITTLTFHYTQPFYKEFALGRRYFENSRYRMSLPYLISAFRVETANIDAALYLLKNFEKLGMHKESGDVTEMLYRNVMSQKPDLEAKIRLAEILIWQKKYDKAITTLKDLTSERPKDFKLIERLADVYSLAKEYGASIGLYKRLIDNDYRTKDIVLKLAEVLRFSGRNKEALELYEKYLEE